MISAIKLKKIRLRTISIKNSISGSKVFKGINIALLMNYIFNALFIPYDNFSLKKVALVLLILLNFKCFLKMKTKDEWIAFFYGTVVMMANVIQSTIVCGMLTENLKVGYTFSILLLYPIIKQNFINFRQLLVLGTRMLAYFIIICFLLDFIGVLSIYGNPILMWLYATENANVGKYSSLLIGISLFLKASPLMLAGMADSFMNKRIVDQYVFLIAMILTGTRANMFFGLAVFIFCFLYVIESRNKRIAVLFLIIIGGILFIFKFNIIEWIQNVRKMKVNSDGIRTGTLSSMFLMWKEHPISFIFGSGYMGEFYNSGRHSMTRDVELSYWNLLRQVGIIQFLILMYMYIHPILILLKKKKGIMYVVAYCGYLMIAYTNPFLITSTGLTMVLFMYYIAYYDQNKKIEFLDKLKVLHKCRL